LDETLISFHDNSFDAVLLLHVRLEVRRSHESSPASFAHVLAQLTVTELLVVLELHVASVESSIRQLLTAHFALELHEVVAFHVR
jgi:hypothetical protein